MTRRRIITLDRTRRRALFLYTSGIMNPAEIALASGVHRQTVAYWCRGAEIKYRERRANKCRELWEATDLPYFDAVGSGRPDLKP